MFRFTKWSAIALLCSLFLVFYVGFIENAHDPDRIIDNNIMNGCYQGAGISVTITKGVHLQIANGPSASIGQLSEIKSETYVHLVWDQSALRYARRLDGYANIKRSGSVAKSITLIELPSGSLILRRKICD